MKVTPATWAAISRKPTIALLAVLWAWLMAVPQFASAQEKYEREPIRYSDSKSGDKVQQLADQIADRTVKLEWDEKSGYLKSVLKKLNVPVSSQALVFSKTSLQVSHISPQSPRATYFNDDIYVGWVQNGDVIEVSAADPKLGATFYSLQQIEPDKVSAELVLLKRETSRCLQCHDSSRTGGRPGHMVRSVYPLESGLPEFSLGTKLSTPQSDFRDRFGGWYVSGTHGQMRHMGNAWLKELSNVTSTRRGNRSPDELDIEPGANVTDLSKLLDVSPYLTPHSDIVAQLVLQHQVHMHNLITEANYSGRQAIHDAKTMNKIFERPAGFESDSTKRRFDRAADKVVCGLLFCDEARLNGPIEGSSQFASEFHLRGPFENHGNGTQSRSLREFDLQTRLFKYPCSFLIYSDAFKQLPQPVLERIDKRLRDVLSGANQSEEFAHLDVETKQAIAEILDATDGMPVR